MHLGLDCGASLLSTAKPPVALHLDSAMLAHIAEGVALYTIYARLGRPPRAYLYTFAGGAFSCTGFTHLTKSVSGFRSNVSDNSCLTRSANAQSLLLRFVCFCLNVSLY